MVAHGSPRAAAAAVGEQRHIGSGCKSVNFAVSGKQAELDEMVAAAAGAELRPSPVFVLFGHWAGVPIRIQHLVLPAVLEAGAHAKTRFSLDCPGESILV